MLTSDDVRTLHEPTGRARGLPGFAYVSEDFAREEHRHLFARTWTCAGYAHEVPDTGDVMPRTVAGVPLVFVRAPSGEIGCFHNVCSHRGATVVEGRAAGQRLLRCRYHGWAYDLEGGLRATPHWGGRNRGEPVGLDKACLGLKPVRMARWHDWLFVNVDGKAPAFEDYAAPFLARCREYDLEHATFCMTLNYEISGNWKLVAENYLETLHLDFVHTVLAEGRAVRAA